MVPLTPRTPVNSHTARAPVDDDARVRTRTRGRVKIVFRDESQDVKEDDEVVLGENRVSILMKNLHIHFITFVIESI